ncbi:MAG: 50S ribosomal protein L24 [Chloroflexi bacterium]|nr:50S ribosomal protein L24 [Chloroflexota bacterium]
MPKFRLKRGDTVEVIAGKDKGKRGTIREIHADDQRVVVSDVNVVKRHMKPGRSGARQAGIVELEAPIHISNVALVDPKANRPTRVGIRTLPDGSRVRFAKRSGEQI